MSTPRTDTAEVEIKKKPISMSTYQFEPPPLYTASNFLPAPTMVNFWKRVSSNNNRLEESNLKLPKIWKSIGQKQQTMDSQRQQRNAETFPPYAPLPAGSYFNHSVAIPNAMPRNTNDIERLRRSLVNRHLMQIKSTLYHRRDTPNWTVEGLTDSGKRKVHFHNKVLVHDEMGEVQADVDEDGKVRPLTVENVVQIEGDESETTKTTALEIPRIASPRISPRVSPRASPRVSPFGTPRNNVGETQGGSGESDKQWKPDKSVSRNATEKNNNYLDNQKVLQIFNWLKEIDKLKENGDLYDPYDETVDELPPCTGALDARDTYVNVFR